MIITTNPHFSQNRVSRDSLPTQSSNINMTTVTVQVENMVGKITNHNRIWNRYPLCIAMAVCIKVPVLQHICSKIWDSFAYTPS